MKESSEIETVKVNQEKITYEFKVEKLSMGELRFNPNASNRLDELFIVNKVTSKSISIPSRIYRGVTNKDSKNNFLEDFILIGVMTICISAASFYILKVGAIPLILYSIVVYLYFRITYDFLKVRFGHKVFTSIEEVLRFRTNRRTFHEFLKKVKEKDYALLVLKINELKDSDVELDKWFKTAKKLLTLTPTLTVDLLPTDINILEELVLKAEEKKIELDKIKREKELLEQEAVEEGERVKRELLTEQNKQLKLEVLSHINQLEDDHQL